MAQVVLPWSHARCDIRDKCPAERLKRSSSTSPLDHVAQKAGSSTLGDDGAIGAMINATTSQTAWLMISALIGMPRACSPPQKAPATLAAPMSVLLPVIKCAPP